MQAKRLLDDRELFADDRVFDAQGRSYAFVEHSGDELGLRRKRAPTLALPALAPPRTHR